MNCVSPHLLHSILGGLPHAKPEQPRSAHLALPCGLGACFGWQVNQIPGRAAPPCMCVIVPLLSKVSLVSCMLSCTAKSWTTLSVAPNPYGWISLLCVSSEMPSTGERRSNLSAVKGIPNHYRLLTWSPDCSHIQGCWAAIPSQEVVSRECMPQNTPLHLRTSSSTSVAEVYTVSHSRPAHLHMQDLPVANRPTFLLQLRSSMAEYCSTGLVCWWLTSWCCHSRVAVILVANAESTH